MIRSRLVFLSALAGWIISACAFMTPAQQVGGAGGERHLAETAWIVVQLGQESGPEFQALTLEFAGTEQINGHDGCNVFSGDVSMEDISIHVGEKLIGTMMACPDFVEGRARAYRGALMQAMRYRLQDSKLQLLDGAGKVLVTLSPAELSLAGSSWDVVSYNNGKQAVVSVVTGTKITARFGKEGRITGHAGCNAYVAAYRVQGPGITIQPRGTTRRACAEPQGVMEQEMSYLQALPFATRYRMSGNRLELRDVHGSLVAILARSRG